MSQLQTILGIVEKLYECHVSLLKLAMEKKEVLIKGDIRALDELVKEELNFFQVLSKLEQQRIQELKQLSIHESIPEHELTLSKLLTLTDDPNELKNIHKLYDEFPVIYEKLKEMNDTNARLLHQSLQFVHRTMQLLYPETQNTYQPQDVNTNNYQRVSHYDYRV